MRTALFLAGLCAALLPIGAANADKGGQWTRCRSLSQAEAVFIGTVQDVKPVTTGLSGVTFAVDQVIRGSLPKTVRMNISGLRDQCVRGKPLAVGDQLLLSAFGSVATGRPLFASCADAVPAANAAADIAFARAAHKRTTGTVEGTLRLYGDLHSSRLGAPRGNVEIRARGTSHATRTKADGSFRLELPPGEYTLEPKDRDPGLVQADPNYYYAAVKIYAQSCADLDVAQVWNGRIRGRLVDHRGKPAAGVIVRTIDLRYPIPESEGERSTPYAVTDANGNYEIAQIPEGKHLVAVSVPFNAERPIPGTYYPGVADSTSARTIYVGLGKLVTGIDFKLRAPQPMHRILGAFTRAGAAVSYHGYFRLTNAREHRTTRIDMGGSYGFDVLEAAGADVTIQVCQGRDGTGPCSREVTLKVTGDLSVSVEVP